MFLAAVLRAGTSQTPAKVRNMSSSGAMIELAAAPSPGKTVELMRGTLIARGSVVWSSPSRCGIRFSSEVLVEDWLAAPTKVQQRRVDEIVSLVKAGGADPVPIDGGPTEARTTEELVDDIGAVIRLMQDLEDDLAASAKTLERHGMKLQHLDIAMQMLRAVACELTPDGGDEQCSLAKLKDLRVACAQALSTG